jgi:hypothetical protein
MKCRVCKHWMHKQDTVAKLASYAEDRYPLDGWISCRCQKLAHGIDIYTYGDGSFDYLETDANFGCVYFEAL